MDRAFHAAVALATHNALLARQLIAVQTLATRFWVAAMGEQSPQEQLDDVALHRDLAAAIAARDPDGGRGGHGAADRRSAQPLSAGDGGARASACRYRITNY